MLEYWNFIHLQFKPFNDCFYYCSDLHLCSPCYLVSFAGHAKNKTIQVYTAWSEKLIIIYHFISGCSFK